MHEGLSYQHYILTRFNYPSDYEHIGGRIKIFRDYTMPSVLGQTNGDFKWLIILNPEHQELFDFVTDTRIEFINRENPKGSNWVSYINNDFSSEYLITTRLDNDDLLRIDAIEKKIITFEKNPKISLIDSKGYRMNGDGTKMVEFNMYAKNKNSPFSTAIKKVNGKISREDTVNCAKHADLHKIFPEVEFLNDRLWIQLIHETNKLNRGMSGNPVNIKELSKFLPPDHKNLGASA